jgi:hypothetical protein
MTSDTLYLRSITSTETGINPFQRHVETAQVAPHGSRLRPWKQDNCDHVYLQYQLPKIG